MQPRDKGGGTPGERGMTPTRGLTAENTLYNASIENLAVHANAMRSLLSTRDQVPSQSRQDVTNQGTKLLEGREAHRFH